MKVLVLSPYPERLAAVFARAGDETLPFAERLDPASLEALKPDVAVSYGYRHILKADTLAVLRGPAINLHIAMLPWNRGSDPNFWSVFDATPKGVTIHAIDVGLDTGPIYAQRAVEFPPEATLASSYAQLQQAMEALFAETWPAIRSGRIAPRPQEGQGSVHRRSEKEPFMRQLPKGWDTPVAEVAALGARHRSR